MENCQSATSVNSILLLKERIIKVETLLEKYASLTRKFNDLEKLQRQTSENERTAKKDAAKYLEKYCKLTKKFTALLSKFKNLEEIVKDKTNLVEEHQNQVTKLDSVLKIYKLERKNYGELKRDKDFLLSLAWKLFKDSRLESNDNKNRKNAEIFFTRFENDLRALKLNDFRKQKLKKMFSQSEELESSSCVELPVLNSIKSDFIDTDVASESEKSISSEVENLGRKIDEGKEKPNEDCGFREQENDMVFTVDTDKSYQSGIGSLFDPLNSEICIGIGTKEIDIDVDGSVNNIISNRDVSTVDGNGFGANTEHSDCTAKQLEQCSAVQVSKEIEIQENQECGEFSHKFSASGDESKLKGSETENVLSDCREFQFCPLIQERRIHSPQIPSETQESKTVSNDHCIPSNQCGRKTASKRTLDADGDSVGIKEVKRVDNKYLQNSDEIISHDFHHTMKSLNNLSFNLSVENGDNVIERRKNNTEETALSILGENDMESCRTDKERTNSEKCKPQELRECPSLVFASANGEPQKNVSPESEETSLVFNEDEEKEEVLKKDSAIEGCEIGQKRVLNSNSILNIKMKAVTADIETLRKTSYPKSSKEIPDEEIFRILENFKKVRLISPLKESLGKKDTGQDRILVKSHGKLRPHGCLINNEFNGSLETKSKINVEKIQISNNTTLHSGNGSSEKSAMVNESTQTHVEENIEDKEENLKTAEQNSKPGKVCTVHIAKGLVRRGFRKIWNGKLKKKLKTLDALTKMLKAHPCCFMFLKIALQYLGEGNINHEKSDTQLVCNFLRNAFIKSRHKSKIRTRKKKLSYWHVEDATVSDTITRKTQYLFGDNEEVNFKPEAAIYNNITRRLNNLYVPPGRDRLMQTQHSDWFSTGKSNCLAQRNVFGNSFRIGLPDSILRDINLDDFKKENETFRCSAVDNCNNCSEPYFGGYYNMLDMKDVHDIPKPIIECDSAMPPESGSTEKAGFYNTIMNSCCSQEKSVEIQNSLVVPRRSSRLQGRNSRLKVLDSSSKYVTDSSNSPVPQIDGCDSVVSRSNASSSASPASCIQSENSTTIEPSSKESESLENRYELLFGETASSEHKENTSDSESLPVTTTFSPKISYNLRHKTVNNATSDNDESMAGGKGIASRLRVPRLTKKAAKSLKSDYSCKQENKESETVAEESSKPLDSTNLLDSIMTAMSKQTEEFKPKVSLSKPVVAELNDAASSVTSTPQHCSFPYQQGVCSPSRNYYNNCNEGRDFVNFIRTEDSWKFEKGSLNENDNENAEASNLPSRKCHEGGKMKKLVENEIRKFLKAEISSVEDGEEKLKPCIAVLEKASDDIIASVIVAEVMANVDEDLQVFDRPAPPLTQTQHRLMIILTMLTNSCDQLSKINYKILNTIWKKLFPESFFWPDDSVEMASRFYSALCKKINYFKGMWRFCFKAVSSMRQRWCIPIFAVFQVWPDILHNANEIQDNILVNTFVNVILHSPKDEALRRKRQEEKLLAIKHLLINFYNFQVNVTIEQLTQQLFKSLWSNTPGSVDALIFVSRCRHWTWIKKNIVPPLIETLTSWSNGTVTDECGFKTLDIIQQISSVVPVEDKSTPPSAKNLISALYQLLSSSGSNLNKEQKIIRTLCLFGHHTGVKEVLCALSNKFPSQDSINIEIKNAISSSCRKRKLFIKNSKNMIKMEVKFKKKKQDMKKKRKKVKKKKVKKLAVGKSASEIPAADPSTYRGIFSSTS